MSLTQLSKLVEVPVALPRCNLVQRLLCVQTRRRRGMEMQMVVLTTITVSSSGSSILTQKITAVRRTAMFTCILL